MCLIDNDIICNKFFLYLKLLIRVRDQGNPEKTATAQVTITVERDQRQPRFVTQSYTAEVSESIRVQDRVNVKPSSIKATDTDLQVSVLLSQLYVLHLMICNMLNIG